MRDSLTSNIATSPGGSRGKKKRILVVVTTAAVAAWLPRPLGLHSPDRISLFFLLGFLHFIGFLFLIPLPSDFWNGFFGIEKPEGKKRGDDVE
ncbi:hypothetical protein ACFX1W_023370 [Malus domestica]